jgi:hypothetical protein
MQTIIGIRAAGVPWGTRCSNIWFALLIHPYIINLIHKGSAKVNVIVKCLVLVKMYGNIPRELLNRINENSEMKINVLPFSFLPIRFLNSLCSFVSRIFHSIVYRDGVNHIVIGINITPRNVLVQLIDKLVGLVDGSNTENRFLIIFSLFFGSDFSCCNDFCF